MPNGHCTIWHSVPGFWFLAFFFKHVSPVRWKVKKKQLTGTFGRQGFLVYPMATLLEEKKHFVFVHVCICVYLCVCVCWGLCLQKKRILNLKSYFLKKLNTPLIFKIRHMVTNMLVNNKSWGWTDQPLKAARSLVLIFDQITVVGKENGFNFGSAFVEESCSTKPLQVLSLSG